MTAIKDLTITAEAKLVDSVPMAADERPGREFLPELIQVKYWPTPEGWRIWSIYIWGHAILKSGEVGKRERCAYWNARAASYAPSWALDFADANFPRRGAR